MRQELDRLLVNYRALVAKVDSLCRRIEEEFAARIACREGCSGCCRHISLSRVEAVALALALAELPVSERESLRERAAQAAPEGPCPLLANSRCLLYAARPLICRTHGLPIVTASENGATVDFCPLNFQGLASLPGDAVIDLEQLNTLLAGVNRLFLAQAGIEPDSEERLTLAEALLLDLGNLN